MKGLIVKGFGGVAGVVAAMALLVFLPAWTVRWWQAWAFLGVFAAMSIVVIVYLALRDPALLRRRMSGGPGAETRLSQRIIMSVSSLGFAGLLVVPALDHRFGWSSVPAWVSIAGDVLFVAGYVGILRVFRENSYTSATIEVAEDQRVISTGPYAIVRHPMYTASLVYLACMPLALGSWWGLLVMAVLIPVGTWRMFDEESMLRKSLAGYTEYTSRVRHRLIPGVW